MWKCKIVELQTKLQSVLPELDMSKVLCKHICGVVNTWNKKQSNLFEHHHCIAYNMVLDVDVFGALLVTLFCAINSNP